MAAGSTYTPIATTTIGSAVSNYTFSSIPTTYTDLVFVAYGKTSAGTSIYMQFNGDTTASNYDAADIETVSNTSTPLFYRANDNTSSFMYANDGMFLLHLMNYSSSSVYKLLIGSVAYTDSLVSNHVMQWKSTSQITSIKLLAQTGTFSVGTQFTLYGIARA
jgi:hypothetical protein